LHVLSTPPAFVLSQDQTLRQNLKPTPPPPKGGDRRDQPKQKSPKPGQTKTGNHHPPKRGGGTNQNFSCNTGAAHRKTGKKPAHRPHPRPPTRTPTPQGRTHQRKTAETDKQTIIVDTLLSSQRTHPQRATLPTYTVSSTRANPLRKTPGHSLTRERLGPRWLNKSYRPTPPNTNQQVTDPVNLAATN
jgi:hypothetical protein